MGIMDWDEFNKKQTEAEKKHENYRIRGGKLRRSMSFFVDVFGSLEDYAFSVLESRLHDKVKYSGTCWSLTKSHDDEKNYNKARELVKKYEEFKKEFQEMFPTPKPECPFVRLENKIKKEYPLICVQKREADDPAGFKFLNIYTKDLEIAVEYKMGVDFAVAAFDKKSKPLEGLYDNPHRIYKEDRSAFDYIARLIQAGRPLI